MTEFTQIGVTQHFIAAAQLPIILCLTDNISPRCRQTPINWVGAAANRYGSLAKFLRNSVQSMEMEHKFCQPARPTNKFGTFFEINSEF